MIYPCGLEMFRVPNILHLKYLLNFKMPVYIKTNGNNVNELSKKYFLICCFVKRHLTFISPLIAFLLILTFIETLLIAKYCAKRLIFIVFLNHCNTFYSHFADEKCVNQSNLAT